MAKTFGDKLRTLRINNNFGFNEFWKTAKISKVYLSAIENGSQIPPPPERQSEFLEIIETKGKISEKDRNEYYDLAARERKEFPADVLTYYSKNEKIIIEIRELIKEKKNEK